MYTVLVVSAHPDDMEIACAGTLLKCKDRGDRVVVCHLSDGNMGHELIMPDELGKMRCQEAKNSGDIHCPILCPLKLSICSVLLRWV